MKSLFTVFALFALSTVANANSITRDRKEIPDLNTIVGGTDVAVGDPIAATTVLVIGKQDGSTFVCSGTVIATDLILTAGHCLGMNGKAQLQVIFNTSMEGGGPAIAVADRRRPANFLDRAGRVSGLDWHDIAMLRLASPIPAGYTISKILPNQALLQNGSTVTLAGYGINVPLVPENPSGNMGAGILRKVDQTLLDANRGTSEILVNLANGKGSCHGDSGGPAFVKNGNELFIAGVASRLTEKDRVANNGNVSDFSCTVEMVYTNVLAHSAWYESAIAELHSQR